MVNCEDTYDLHGRGVSRFILHTQVETDAASTPREERIASTRGGRATVTTCGVSHLLIRSRGALLGHLEGLSPEKHRRPIHKTQFVAEGVFEVERPLPPWSRGDRIEILDLQFHCPGVHALQVADGEVDVIGVRTKVEVVGVGSRVEAREDRSITIEVVAAGSDPHSGHGEQPRIELLRAIDVRHRQDYPEQSRRVVDAGRRRAGHGRAYPDGLKDPPPEIPATAPEAFPL